MIDRDVLALKIQQLKPHRLNAGFEKSLFAIETVSEKSEAAIPVDRLQEAIADGITQALGLTGVIVQILYAILCLVGIALPLAQFIPWLSEHGFNVLLFIQLAVANPVSAFAWADLLVSAAVVAAFVLMEGRRLGMRHAWLPLLGLAVGVSLALPLFLLLRERHLAAGGPNNSFRPDPSRRSA